MTMHLAHPALTTTGRRKGRQKWASAEQKRQAQELEQQFPELISTDGEGKKGVKYQNAVAVLFEAIKEQQCQIEYLKSKIG